MAECEPIAEENAAIRKGLEVGIGQSWGVVGVLENDE